MKPVHPLSISAVLFLLLGLLLPAPWLRAGANDEEAAVQRGRAHIEKTCLRCHPGAQFDSLVRRKAGDRELPAALDEPRDQRPGSSRQKWKRIPAPRVIARGGIPKDPVSARSRWARS